MESGQTAPIREVRNVVAFSPSNTLEGSPKLQSAQNTPLYSQMVLNVLMMSQLNFTLVLLKKKGLERT